MLKITLIDDEPESLQFIATLVELYAADLEVVGMYSDPAEGLEAILQQPPDLLLLDIDMPGITGFELLRKLAVIEFDVIFITAYNEYAFEAFKFHALDFLHKPVEPDRFVKAVERAKERFKEKDELRNLKSLQTTLNKELSASQRQESRIALPTQRAIEIVPLKNIIRIEADRTYSTFHLIDNQKIVVSKNLGYYDSLDRHELMRSQKSHMINLCHVLRYIHAENSVEMVDGSIIPVSSTHKEELIQRLLEIR